MSQVPVSTDERDRAVVKYQRLVSPIAKRFQFEYRLQPEDAEDMGGEAFIDLIKAASKKGDALSEPYVNKTIARAVSRECFKILAAHGRRRVKHPETGKLIWPDEYIAETQHGDGEDLYCVVEETPEDQYVDEACPTNHASNNLDILIVRDGLATLTPQETEIIHLRHALGLTVRQTARETGLDKSKVSRLGQRVRKQLEYLRE